MLVLQTANVVYGASCPWSTCLSTCQGDHQARVLNTSWLKRARGRCHPLNFEYAVLRAGMMWAGASAARWPAILEKERAMYATRMHLPQHLTAPSQHCCTSTLSGTRRCVCCCLAGTCCQILRACRFAIMSPCTAWTRCSCCHDLVFCQQLLTRHDVHPSAACAFGYRWTGASWLYTTQHCANTAPTVANNINLQAATLIQAVCTLLKQQQRMQLHPFAAAQGQMMMQPQATWRVSPHCW